MSISSVAGSASTLVPIPNDTTAAATTADAKSKTGGASGGGSGGTSGTSNVITNTSTLTNADGSITTITTYADGTTSTTTQANPNPTPVSSQGVLSKANSGQLGTLLSAQEQSNPASASSANGQANGTVAPAVPGVPGNAPLGTLLSTQS